MHNTKPRTAKECKCGVPKIKLVEIQVCKPSKGWKGDTIVEEPLRGTYVAPSQYCGKNGNEHRKPVASITLSIPDRI
jgi:hypothetical protein